MLKEHIFLYRQALIFLDGCIIASMCSVAYLFIRSVNQINVGLARLLIIPVAMLLVWHLFKFFKLYDAFRLKKVSTVVSIILNTFLFETVLISAIVYISAKYSISRYFYVFVALLIVSLVLEFLVLSRFFSRMRMKVNHQNILIVGSGPRAQKFIASINEHDEWGLNIVGIIDGDPKKVGETVKGHPVLGTFEDAPSIIHAHVVDEIVFLVPRTWLSRIEKLISFCETEGLRINLAVDHYDFKIAHSRTVVFNGLPLVNCSSDPDLSFSLLFKRLIDICVSAVSLIVLAPLFLAVTLAIKATSKGPVLFQQKRCSRNRRVFNFYKFRTMVPDAESRLEQLQKSNELKGPAFKMTNDPRVTPLGRFLRQTSLDELPQLWNVLKGDMSIVGPRPPIPSEVDKYNNWHRRRLSMRPGLTCLWQVGGRNNITDFDEWMKLDLEYIDRWSMWLDLTIMCKTVPAVLFRTGAK